MIRTQLLIPAPVALLVCAIGPIAIAVGLLTLPGFTLLLFTLKLGRLRDLHRALIAALTRSHADDEWHSVLETTATLHPCWRAWACRRSNC